MTVRQYTCRSCKERRATRVFYMVWPNAVGYSWKMVRVCARCLRAWIAMHEDLGPVHVTSWRQAPLFVQAAVPEPPPGAAEVAE